MKRYHSIKKKGFTLIELIIVIVILGILASMAYVAYPNITAQANVTKVAQSAKKIQEGIDAMALDDNYLYYRSFCLNPEVDEACMEYTDRFNWGSVWPYEQEWERLNKFFSLTTLGKSSYFNKSDLVYLGHIPLILSFKSDNETVKYTNQQAIGYHIGSQKNCANDDVAWYDKNNKVYFSSKPTQEQITINSLSLTRYYPIDANHNFCVLLSSLESDDIGQHQLTTIPINSEADPIPM